MFVRTHNDVSHDIGSSVCARHLIHVSCACVFDLSSTFSSHSSFVSPIFHFFFLNLDFYLFSSMWMSSEQDPLCTLPNEEVGPLANNAPLTDSGLIAGGQNSSRDRQTVFFTAVNPMHKNHQDPIELDLTKPRLASHKQKWKVHQDTVCWVDFQLAQRKGLKFCQTRSDAAILCDTLPAYCISKAIVMKSAEIIYQKVFASPRPPPTISCKDNWTCGFDSDVARRSRDIQRIELKPNTQLSSTGRFVTKWSEETLERTKFDLDTLNQEKHDNVTDPTSTGRLVCGHESTERCVLTPVRGDPSRWIKERNTKLISEYQDCHTQLYRKQNISEFKSLYKGSKIILIEQHFKPTCNRITSTSIQQQSEGDDPRLG